MATSILDVGDLFSILGAHGIERQLGQVAGVGRVSVNPVSGSTTVVYDPAKTSLSTLQAAIKECGFHCAGEALPRHLCATGADHEAMVSAAAKPAAAKTDHKPQEEEKSDAMAHEMGHDGGMDMQTMVRDMRNRFWIALGFSLPIFAFSPMGMDFIKIPPPFGLRLDLVLFLLASAAILYPVWPFIVAAYRAIQKRLRMSRTIVCISMPPP